MGETEVLLTSVRDKLMVLINQLKLTNTNHIVVDNLNDLADIINGNKYNNLTQYYLVEGQTLTIPRGSIHAISYVVLDGTVDVSIGGITLPYIKGESDSEEVTTFINSSYTFTPKINGVIKIKTIN